MLREHIVALEGVIHCLMYVPVETAQSSLQRLGTMSGPRSLLRAVKENFLQNQPSEKTIVSAVRPPIQSDCEFD